MGRYFPDLPNRQKNQMGQVETDPTLYVAEEVFNFYPVDFLWGKSRGTSGEHPEGLALDFSGLAYGNGPDDPGPMDKELCDNIAEYLWINRERLRVWYIIWNRRTISTNPKVDAFNKWTEYQDDDPHTDHVHVSFYDTSYTPPKERTIEMTPQELLSAKVTLSEGQQKWFGTGIDELSVAGLLGYAGAGAWAAVYLLKAQQPLLKAAAQRQPLTPQQVQDIADEINKINVNDLVNELSTRLEQ